jgi:hypothetical protein
MILITDAKIAPPPKSSLKLTSVLENEEFIKRRKDAPC